MPNSSRIAVVGGGIGGLTAAICLARDGAEVALFEKEAEVGGKVRVERIRGHAIDVGPTVLTMRHVFDDLFASCGERLDDYVTLSASSHVARHMWAGGEALDLYTDVEQNAEAIAHFAGSKEADGYRRFAAYAQAIYETVKGPFLDSQRPSITSMMRDASRIGFSSLASIDAHRTMWKSLASFFKDERLRQLFGRYATYAGSSPFDAPATLHLISHVERSGVHIVRGGMIELAKALAWVAQKVGVSIHTQASVSEITVARGRATGVRLSSGEWYEAEAVVANCDASALATGRFGAAASKATAKVAPKHRSLSAVTWAIVGDVHGAPLAHHNVFFSDDYPREFDEIVGQRRFPSAPSVYVCAEDRLAPEKRSEGDERLFVIVNAPPIGDRSTSDEKEIDQCESAMFRCLSRTGLSLSVREMKRTTPIDFERRFPATGGAIYGQASIGPFSALSRPASRTNVSRLYLASGSGHPGAGVPMVALSGKLAARAITCDLASTPRSLRTATSGSISMR